MPHCCKDIADYAFCRQILLVFSCLLIFAWSSNTHSICLAYDHDQLYENADIVFTAKLNFSRDGFRSTKPGEYIRTLFYVYESMYVWKGDPGQFGTAYEGVSDTFVVYSEPVLGKDEQDRLAGIEPPPESIKLIYANETAHGLVYGGCTKAKYYDDAVPERLSLGEPARTYGEHTFKLPTVDEILRYIDKMRFSYPNHDSFNNLESMLDTLLDMDAQEAMFDYITTHKIMYCQHTSRSIKVISEIIIRLPDHMQQIYDKYSFMFSCSQQNVRLSVFKEISQIVSSKMLVNMIDQFMFDPSTSVKKAVAESVSRLNYIDKQSLIDRASDMLDSADPDQRVFAAILLRNINEIDASLINKVCQTKPASWQYQDDPVHTESVQDQCDDLIRLHQQPTRDAGLLHHDGNF